MAALNESPGSVWPLSAGMLWWWNIVGNECGRHSLLAMATRRRDSSRRQQQQQTEDEWDCLTFGLELHTKLQSSGVILFRGGGGGGNNKQFAK